MLYFVYHLEYFVVVFFHQIECFGAKITEMSPSIMPPNVVILCRTTFEPCIILYIKLYVFLLVTVYLKQFKQKTAAHGTSDCQIFIQKFWDFSVEHQIS